MKTLECLCDSTFTCSVCQDCPHDEFEHEICLDCGYERDPGEAIDRAMDLMEDK